jgi:twitching motility protein PilT
VSAPLHFPSEWSRRLVASLVASGTLGQDTGNELLGRAADANRPVAALLAESGAVDAATCLVRLSELSGIPSVDIFSARPMGEAFKLVPESLAREFRVIGYQLRDGRLTLACAEPLSANEVRNLSAFLERDVAGLVLADPLALERLMSAVYPRLAAAAPSAETGGPSSDDGAGGPAAPSGGPPTPNGQSVGEAAPPSAPTPFAAPVTALAPPSAPSGAPTGRDPFDRELAVVGARAGHGASARGDEARTPMPPGFRPPAHEVRPFAAIAGTKTTLDIDDLLTYAVENGASDLHLTNQLPPSIRVDGSIRPIEGLPRLDNEQIREMIFGILTQSLRERFEAERELDTSHSIMGVGRFRVNVFQQRGSIGAVLRAIPHEIPPFETLGLPEVIASFAELRRGLVLVTGPTGSGKSTTLASLINIINRTKPLHIMTVEDPIEFLHTHDRAIVNQREVGSDTTSFAEALRHVLRQDPDVILVGEMRDIETISTALTAAETGHLVFATLHTQDAPQTIDRIIDVFPTNQQDQVRIQLAGSLEAVVTQQLILSASGLGRVAVAEVMVCTPAIRNLIRSAKTHQVYSLMQTGGAVGMQTMDQGLAKAVREGKITEAMAFDRCHDPNELRDQLSH